MRKILFWGESLMASTKIQYILERKKENSHPKIKVVSKKALQKRNRTAGWERQD